MQFGIEDDRLEVDCIANVEAVIVNELIERGVVERNADDDSQEVMQQQQQGSVDLDLSTAASVDSPEAVETQPVQEVATPVAETAEDRRPELIESVCRVTSVFARMKSHIAICQSMM